MRVVPSRRLAAIIMPLIYCERRPSVTTVHPGFTGPFIISGGAFFSGREMYASAPSWRSASTTCITGRVRIDSSPVKTLHPSNVAATGDIKYSSEPESPTFTTSDGRCAFFPAPSTIQSAGSDVSTFAPNSGTARLEETQSAPPSGFLI